MEANAQASILLVPLSWLVFGVSELPNTDDDDAWGEEEISVRSRYWGTGHVGQIVGLFGTEHQPPKVNVRRIGSIFVRQT